MAATHPGGREQLQSIAHAVIGRVVRGFEGLDVGERVRVQLVHTDVARGFIDFAAVRQKP